MTWRCFRERAHNDCGHRRGGGKCSGAVRPHGNVLVGRGTMTVIIVIRPTLPSACRCGQPRRLGEGGVLPNTAALLMITITPHRGVVDGWVLLLDAVQRVGHHHVGHEEDKEGDTA